MVLVPAEQAAQAFSTALQMPGQEFPATVQTQGTTTSRLDSDMSAILHSLEFKDDREKWQRYEQALQRFLSLKHLQGRPVSETLTITKSKKHEDEKNMMDVEKIVQKIPKTYRGKGRKLLDFSFQNDLLPMASGGTLLRLSALIN